MPSKHLLIATPILFLAACAADPAPPFQSAAVSAAPAPRAAEPPPAPATSDGPDSLLVRFDSGKASIRSDQKPVIDHAARLFRDGAPLLMTVSGYTDHKGKELPNLVLSAKRAEVVKDALVAEGIPADRLEARALGSAPDPKDLESQPEGERRVVITWK